MFAMWHPAWRQGLKWGACAWLVYIAFRAGASAALPLFGRAFRDFLMPWPSSSAPWMTMVWLATLALVAAGSRWSRVGTAAAICAQAAVGTKDIGDWAPSALLFLFVAVAARVTPRERAESLRTQ
jgi:hypothetical protein